jgi:NDP-sugar pyrophosphorylase family protein
MTTPKQAYLLIGGRGTRLASIVSDRPKPMAIINCRPFVTYLFDQLLEVGIRRFILCVGHLAHVVRDELGTQYKGAEIIYSQEMSPLGTAGAVRLAWQDHKSDPLLILNGDSYCGIDFKKFFTAYDPEKMNGLLALIHQEDCRRYGSVTLKDSGEIQRFEEKSTLLHSGWINGGIYLLSSAIIENIPPDHNISIEKDVFPNLINQGLFGLGFHCPFIDIGTPESFAQAESFFKNTCASSNIHSI